MQKEDRIMTLGNAKGLKDQLVTAKRAEPFRPFTIHLTDGKRLIVDRADCFILGRRGRTVAVNTRDDRLQLIDVSLIAKLTTRRKPAGRKK
jgi:hypothetical protein